MILTIDTTAREATIFGLISDTEIVKDIKTENKSENILKDLEVFLRDNNISLKDLKAILVNVGPGSYTGTRIGVTVANTLAWSLNIPVFSFTSENRDIVLSQAKTISGKFKEIVLPLYSDQK